MQAACYEEVSRVTGEERPGLAHQRNLPFCQAVIMEVQRLACVAPQSIPHRWEYPGQARSTKPSNPPLSRVTRDVTADGYDIPANSLALANLMGFMNDPDVWEQPQKFRPERFLERTETGWKLVKEPPVIFAFQRETLKVFMRRR